MFITELFEAAQQQTLVIIPGGFHPFHPGHLSLYRSAQKAFPGATIIYAATDDQKERPFAFADKQKLATIAGVPAGAFQMVKSPFVAREITQNFDPNTTVLIFARSEKDRDEPPRPGGVKKNGEPSYLQPYAKGDLAPMTQHGYMAYLPTVQFDAGPSGVTSATQIRNMWPQADDAQKNAIIADLYPRNPAVAREILDKYLGGGLLEVFDKEAFRQQMRDLEAREELRKTDPVSAKALDLRGQLPQKSKKKPEDDAMSINDPRHPQYAYTQAGYQGMSEGKIQYGVLDNDNVNLIIDKSVNKPDGIYSFRGILFRVKGGKVTHYAADGKILQAMGRVNTQIGSYDSSTQAKSILKSIKQGVAEETVDEKSVSKAQFRTMAAAAHNPKFAKKVGISQNVAQEFHSADKKQSYKSLPNKVDEDQDVLAQLDQLAESAGIL